TADEARLALQAIPSPAVDEAFRAALPRLSGAAKAGLIGSIGARRDRGALEALASCAASRAEVVARAAISALGRLGTPEAAAALRRGGFAAGVEEARWLALWVCVEQCESDGRHEEARAMARGIAESAAPERIRDLAREWRERTP